MSMIPNKSICFFCDPYDTNLHKKIEDEIVANQYAVNGSSGFQIAYRRFSNVYASYIEKREFAEIITDPFGNTTEFQRIEYQQIQFQLRQQPPHIIIFNPQRYYRKLLNIIAQFSSFTIAIEEKVINVIDWVSEVLKNDNDGKINKVEVEKIAYDSKTIGALSLSSDDDLRPKLETILESRPHFLKKVTVTFDKIGRSNLELYSNGRITFQKAMEIDEFNSIYNAFCKILLLK